MSSKPGSYLLPFLFDNEAHLLYNRAAKSLDEAH
jgi:hypothetical protein